MKHKITVLTLLIALCTLAGALTFITYAEKRDESRDLCLPDSYEQYLELNDPSAYAQSERYIAIVDNQNNDSILYLFDKVEQTYSRRDFADTKISAVRFYNNHYLFYLTTLNICYVNCSTPDATPVKMDVNATSFIVHDNTVYFSQSNNDVTYIKKISFDNNMNLSGTETEIDQGSSNSQIPAFSLFEDKIYYTMGFDVKDADGKNTLYHAPYSITSFYIHDITTVYYVDSNNLFYENSNRLFEGSFANLKFFEGNLYVIDKNNKSIRRFDITTKSFTPYEIGKYSDNPNRINRAQDISIYDDKLVIADTGNQRVRIIDYSAPETIAEQPRVISGLDFNPQMVCAGENNFAITSNTNVYFYNYDGTVYGAENGITGNIIGCAYAYGTYYFITDYQNNVYAYNVAERALSKNVLNGAGTPVSIAADIYGSIYVYTAGGTYQYTAEAFMTPDGTREIITNAQFGINVKKILVDYAGNVYGLGDDVIHAYNRAQDKTTVQTLNLNTSNYVYNQKPVTALSFAFGLTDENVFVLSDGFILRKQIGIRTLNNIPSDDLYNDIYTAQPTVENLLVDVPAGAVAVKLDIAALEAESDFLPYRSFEQLAEAGTGIVLGKTEEGYLVDFFCYVPAGDNGVMPQRYHRVYLIARNSPVQPTITENYFIKEEKTGYISSEVSLYRRPGMETYTRGIRLAREQEVNVLGKIALSAHTLDNDYYYVETSAGMRGFVPAGFITAANVAELENEKFAYQTLKKGKSVTLTAAGGETLTLSNRERLKVYETETKDGYKTVSYQKDGITYYGEIEKSCLSEASKMMVVTLVIVTLVTAMVLFNVCYLIFRRKPKLE